MIDRNSLSMAAELGLLAGCFVLVVYGVHSTRHQPTTALPTAALPVNAIVGSPDVVKEPPRVDPSI